MPSIRLTVLLLPLLLFFNCQKPQPVAPAEPLPGHYETRRNHDPNGIGKFYLGREIARVMGYQGADWLERPERIEEERPDEVVARMALRPGDVIADIVPEPDTSVFVLRRSSPPERSSPSISNRRCSRSSNGASAS